MSHKKSSSASNNKKKTKLSPVPKGNNKKNRNAEQDRDETPVYGRFDLWPDSSSSLSSPSFARDGNERWIEFSTLEEAHDLNVSVGDRLLVVSSSDMEQYRKDISDNPENSTVALVARVRVANPSTPTTPRKRSPIPPRKLKPGCIRITPLYAAERFIVEEEKEEEGESLDLGSDPMSILLTPEERREEADTSDEHPKMGSSWKTPTPQKKTSSFSFQSFVKSSSTPTNSFSTPKRGIQTKTNTPSTGPRSSSAQKGSRASVPVLAIPLSRILSSSVQKDKKNGFDSSGLFQPLHSMTVVTADISSEVVETCQRVLTFMVRSAAQSLGWLQVGDSLVLSSFRGQSHVSLRIIDASSPEPQTLEKGLNDALSTLTLAESHEGKTPDARKDDEEDSLRSPTGPKLPPQLQRYLVPGKQPPLLYCVQKDTRIRIESSSLSTPSKSDEGNLFDSVASKEKSSAVSMPARDDHKSNNVAGLDSIRNRIITFLRIPLLRPELFHGKLTSSSIRPPRGLVLHGPGGVGKTQLAMDVGKYFSSLGQHILVRHVNCSSIKAASLSGVVGEAERMLLRYFADDPESMGPDSRHCCVLLIVDDIHLICPRRSFDGGFANAIDRLASTLLAVLDGVGRQSEEGPPALAVLATTSHLSSLDPALRRPGRLDMELEVPVPDETARAAIFGLHLKRAIGSALASSTSIFFPEENQRDTTTTESRSNLLGDKFLREMAQLARGFTGADCALSVKEATQIALLRRRHQSLQEKGVAVGSTPMASESKTAVVVTMDDMRKAISSTKPSTIRSVTVEVPKVPWSSVGGMDDVKRLLREAVELPLTHSDLFNALRIPPPRGVLLYGPPGCSKTLMARALATEGSMNFLAVKGPELLSKWLGESERTLAALFRRARLATPCIIFFDEIDAIGSRRGSDSGGGGGERLLSQLLTEIDGVRFTASSSSQGDEARVVVVAATNRPDLLDPALTRPGRIDRMIYVGVPDRASREAILRLSLLNKPCDEDVDIAYLASDDVTDGYSGAEIVCICRHAALHALEEFDTEGSTSSPKISLSHLLKSVGETTRQITPEMLAFYASFRNKNSTGSPG